MVYWFIMLGYTVTVRVVAAPGNLGSKSLGYIDRAQKIEAYCIAVAALLITASIGQFAIVVVPMSATAVGLCITDAIRLSKVSLNHNYMIYLFE